MFLGKIIIIVSISSKKVIYCFYLFCDEKKVTKCYRIPKSKYELYQGNSVTERTNRIIYGKGFQFKANLLLALLN